MRKDIDLRIEVGEQPFWVLFFGKRPSIDSPVGHAYIGFGREDDSHQMSWQEGFGLYPESRASGGLSLVMGKVPGKLQKEDEINSDVVISCRVSRAQYESALAIRDEWSSGPDYRLIYQDCVSFAFSVAKKLGLKLPTREMLPDSILLPIRHMEMLALNSTEDFSNGDWLSIEPAQRWRLLLSVEDGKWTERSASGNTLEAPCRVIRIGERRFRVERENSADVLAFLGARDNVRQALIALGAKPSYMILDRLSPTHFQAQWFGLRWTLDAKNNLKTVIQPGEAAGSTYTLNRKL